MKLHLITASDKSLRFRLPTRFLLNGITAWYLSRRLHRRSGQRALSVRQLRKLFSAVHAQRKRLGSTWELLSVRTRRGLRITLFP